MSGGRGARPGGEAPRRGHRRGARLCPICRREAAFAWQCRCGFEMCQACMDENLWGLTCNRVTWTCPDCGEINSY